VTWRTPTRLDRQVADLWAVLALGAMALVPVWQSLLSSLPLCPVRAWSGIPCPGCGAGRSAAALLGGDVLDAAGHNPLFTLAAIVFVVAGLAAPLWARLGGRLPDVTASPTVAVRIALASVLVGNWAYLIVRGA
jgi:hypothetical protein